MCRFPSLSWIIVGDFNCVLLGEEKKGGLPPLCIECEEFFNWMSACELFEPPQSGLKFSWSNNRNGAARIMAKLDGMLVNRRWAEDFEGWSYRILPRQVSDHPLLVSRCSSIPKPVNRHFYFTKMWVEILSFNMW